MSVAFFNPESPFGTLTGWEIQNNNPNKTQDRAQALGASGDESASKLHNEKKSESASYVLATAAGCKIPKFGEILNGYHVDSVSIKFTNTGFVTMDVAGHKHGNGSTAHPSCRTYTGSLTTIATNFGCPSTVPGAEIPSGAGVRSVTWTLDGNHVDELGSAGEFLAGDNYDGKETTTVELCDGGTITAKTGWDCTTSSNSFGNTSAATASATVEKHITGVTPSPSST